jgi:competence protein ComEC
MTVDLRLAVPAVAMWAVCALVIAAPEIAGIGAAVAWGIAAAGAASAGAMAVRRAIAERPSIPSSAARRRRRRLARAVVRGGWTATALSVVAVALALTSIAGDAPRRSPSVLEEAARTGGAVALELRADTTPHRVSGGFDGSLRWMWKGTAMSVTRDGLTSGSDAPISVIASMSAAEARAIAFGASVRVSGSVRPNEPGESTVFTVSARDAPTVLHEPPPWLGWTIGLRAGFSQAAAQTPGDGGKLLPGLSIGDVAAVGPELDEAMKVSALSHLTAVSGANCALVTGIVFVVCGFAGLGRRMRVMTSLAALIAFVVLVTPGASVIRAATMAVVVLIALARGRPAQGVPVLSLAVIVLLVHDPWLARDYGFALSVLATAGLLVLARPLAHSMSLWMPRSLATLVSIPLAAQLACQPVLILLSPTLPLFGVGANLLAEPAAPFATIVGLAACLVLPVAPVLGQALVWAAWAPSAWIAAVAHTASTLPGTALPWLDGPVGVVLCAGAVVAVAIVALARRQRGRGIVVVVAMGSLIAGAGVYAGSLGGETLGRTLAIPSGWQIAACDVGQGDALLLRDGDRFAMIDVGRTPEPATACLDRLGVSRLDLLVLTHYDADHVGGVSAVVGRVTTALVGETDDAADERTLAGLRAGGARIVQGTAGMHGTLGALTWRVVWPPAVAPGASALSGNPGSVTLLVEGRGMTSVFLGDLGEREQDALLASGALNAADVVKVAHHGSADQSGALYRQLGAALGLLSVGAKNGYGHPTERAFELLAAAGTTSARTDRQGLLLVSPGSEPGRVALWAEHPDDQAQADGAGPRDGGGSPYAGGDRGGTWRHEAAAGRARAQGARRPPFRSSSGTRSGRRRWCWCRVRKAFSPTVRSACCATASRPKIRASRSATSPPTTTRRASCSPWPARRCSASPGSSGSRASRSATTSS